MNQYARSFMEFCYPGIENYPFGKPIILWSETIKERLGGQEVFLFCIHRITDVFNDVWEIKADTFFLIKNGKIYLIAEETTNYEQKVVIYSGQIFDFKSEEVTLSYSVENSESFKQVVVPKSKWKPIELILEIINTPEGEEPEEIRKLFIGEKFPINLSNNLRYPAVRKEECVLIPKQDVIKVLLKSEKIQVINSLPEQGDYIPFNKGCYKMH